MIICHETAFVCDAMVAMFIDRVMDSTDPGGDNIWSGEKLLPVNMKSIVFY